MDNKNIDIGMRLIEAFETSDKALIAQKLGFESVQAVYKVIAGDRELDFEKLHNFQAYTKCSIDWLLTGDGEKYLHPQPPSFDEIIDEKIRKIVREELGRREAVVSPLQELGDIDDFDLNAAIEEYDDVNRVLEAWYAHEGVKDLGAEFGFLFSGWDGLDAGQKIELVKDCKKITDKTLRS